MSVSSSTDVSDLVMKINQIVEEMSGDKRRLEDSRRRLLEVSEHLCQSLRTPMDFIQELLCQPACLIASRIAIQAGWFKALADANGPKSIQEIATATAYDQQLIKRLFRVLESYGIVKREESGMYTPTPISMALGHPDMSTRLLNSAGEDFRAVGETPEWLAQNGYKAPTDVFNTPFTQAYGMSYWEYLKQNPESGALFNSIMAMPDPSTISWFDSYPIADRLASGLKQDSDAVLMIDIGGGRGHELQEFKARHGALPGRMIVQDLPQVIADIDRESIQGLEVSEYDFFEEQHIKGAKFYYLRHILHDWSDEGCRRILRNQMSAMHRGYSRLIINDRVLSDTTTSVYLASLDFSLMATLGGIERSESDWHALLASVGLQIRGIWSLGRDAVSVIEADFEGDEQRSVSHPKEAPVLNPS